MNTALTTAYQSLVDDLGRWAEVFGLRPDAPVAGTGQAHTDSPTFVMGNVSAYRTDEGGIHIHRRVPGVPGEVVFMLRPRPGEDAEMVGDVFLLDAPEAANGSAN